MACTKSGCCKGSTRRAKNPSTARCTIAAAMAQGRKRSSSARQSSRMTQLRRGGVVFGQEAVHGAVQAHRHRLHRTRADAAQETSEAFVLVQHQVVLKAVELLAL